jgi:protein-tyrosine phosphatase
VTEPDDVRRVLFVCLGNICRSPTGEGVLRHLVAERGLAEVVEIDSAGVGSWHIGEPADARMRQAASRRGYDLASRARQVSEGDFDHYDLIVAMDRSNHSDLSALQPADARAELRLFSDFLPAGSPADVPDPYYGGPQGFDRVLDLIEEGTEAILDHLLSGAAGRRAGRG